MYTYIYIYAVCSHGGDFPHQDYSFREYVYAVCSHAGEFAPELFLYGMCTRCVKLICDSL